LCFVIQKPEVRKEWKSHKISGIELLFEAHKKNKIQNQKAKSKKQTEKQAIVLPFQRDMELNENKYSEIIFDFDKTLQEITKPEIEHNEAKEINNEKEQFRKT